MGDLRDVGRKSEPRQLPFPTPTPVACPHQWGSSQCRSAYRINLGGGGWRRRSDPPLLSDRVILFVFQQGTYIACRQILSTSPSSASETSYLSASVVNTLTFALPILCAFFSVPLAIVSGFKWRKAYHKFETFRELLLSSPSTSPTEEERDQAAVIWRDFAESWRTSSIGKFRDFESMQEIPEPPSCSYLFPCHF